MGTGGQCLWWVGGEMKVVTDADHYYRRFTPFAHRHKEIVVGFYEVYQLVYVCLWLGCFVFCGQDEDLLPSGVIVTLGRK